MEKIIIIDFGSQYTQLIARKVRELNVFCEIFPFNHLPEINEDVRGIILSGSPFSVRENNAPKMDLLSYSKKLPVLGICYGAQLMTQQLGGQVAQSNIREYGRAELRLTESKSVLFQGLTATSQVWMSHSDTILKVPQNAEIIASTADIPVAAFELKKYNFFGLQFHPEVTHTIDGKSILNNFLQHICLCQQDWTPAHFVDSTVRHLKEQLGTDKVVMALSGGVDSTVAATLISKAIGEKLHCIFVDNGLLRKNEFNEVLEKYESLHLNVTGIDAKAEFYAALHGKADPEDKRKAIGKTFIEIFEREAKKLKDVKWLGQGTIYPDVIESAGVQGPAATIKSHHNVGGLPEKMHLNIVEPLRMLFKDEVRKVAREVGIPERFYKRHPFPGPGLGIRVLGEITPEKVKMLQEADYIYINELIRDRLYDNIWQAGAILLPVRSVGVMGDERTYEYTIALRAVTSTDGMTADWYPLPYDFMSKVSSKIINSVKGINRVVYDISSKPPATIEWE